MENNSIDTRPITAKSKNFYSENKDIDVHAISSETNMKSEGKAPLSTNSVPWMHSENENSNKKKPFTLAKAYTDRELFKMTLENSEKKMHQIINESKTKIFNEVMTVYDAKAKIVHKVAEIDNFYTEREQARSPKSSSEINFNNVSNYDYVNNYLYQVQPKNLPSNFEYVQSKAEIKPFEPNIPTFLVDEKGNKIHTRNRLRSANKGYVSSAAMDLTEANKNKEKASGNILI